MKTLSLLVAAFFASLLSLSAHADYLIIDIGPNPNLIPSPGGDGTFNCVGAAPGCEVEKTFTSVGVIPLIIEGGPGSGTVHIAETIHNDSGVTWTDFHFLYFRIDANQATFVTFSNLTNADWASSVALQNSLTLFGSSIVSGDSFEVAFDLNVVLPDPLNGFATFALLEIPSVAPAPGTLALLGFALAGFGALRRRQS